MVIDKFFLAAGLLAANISATAQPASSLFGDGKNLRYVVKSSTPGADSRQAEACQENILDERRMAFFIRNAVVSTATNYSRALVQGDCTGEGFVVAHERRAYRLTIDSATGWGAVESGPRTTYLYCARCEGLLEKDFNLGP
ncbi:hypothetical protein [Acidovorax sp.]|uniref:hypothetical protein n=1 Tax=Acidovorax sp. TaxID=1872122 RepID=UPI0039195537